MLLRRFALLLTVVLAAAGAGEDGSRPLPELRGAAELVAPDHDPSSALIRTSFRLLSAGWQVGAVGGPWPRDCRARPVDPATTRLATPSAITVTVARVAEALHRDCARPIARAHSGFLTSPSTAPPPFRFV